MTEERTDHVDPETVSAEKRDASAAPRADRPPTEDEERAAEEQTLDPHVAESYREAAERGAAVKGEGQIDP